MQIRLLIDAGEMKPGPALSQKMGPLGMNLGKIISDINKATEEFKGMKVPVILDINAKNKTYKIEVKTPPVSALLKKEISADKGSPEPNKIKIGNISIEQIIKIAKIKEKDMNVNDLKKAVINVLGSCVSLGLLVENRDAREIIQEINNGNYDKLIEKGVDKPSQEKIEKLAKDFEKIKKSQEAYVKELEAKKEKAATSGSGGGEVSSASKTEVKEEKKK